MDIFRKYSILPLLTLIIFLLIPLGMSAAPKKAAKAFTVVIDAGHGGKDTGAVDNNVKEKDINLGVSLQLAELIKKKLKDVNVVLTRDNDTFLTLQERADKANKAKGNLFISIHTNSVDKSNKNRNSVAGASVYALGLHKDQNNMKVAQRENAVIELEKNFEQKYSGFDPSKDESYIIFEMAQKKNLSQSIKFANEAQRQLVSVAGRRDRGVHQAGFWVLWATSMPAVLVELDFICNPNSAKYMASEQGQKKLAESLFNAVKIYAESYNKGTGNGGKRNLADADTGSDADLDMASATQSATEATVSTARRKEVSIAPQTSSSRRTSAARRRRSASAKAISDRREVETASIPIQTAPTRKQIEEELTASAGNDRTEKAESSSKQKKSKKGKDKKQNDKKQQKTAKNNKNGSSRQDGEMKVRQAFASAQPDTKHAAGRRSTRSRHYGNNDTAMKTVYKIQLLASADELKQNNPRFCGLEPVSSFRENNLYKYTYGESENKKEIEALLNQVKSKIPDAFIIKITKLDDTGNIK